VDCIVWKGEQNATATEHDFLDCQVVGQHRGHYIGAASLGDIVGYVRALCGEGFSLAACAIVNNKSLPRFEQAQRHGLAHMAQPDEAHIHDPLRDAVV
jgi:hypothetical protein